MGSQSPAVNADGSVVVVSAGTIDRQLRPLAPYGPRGGYTWALNDTGGLGLRLGINVRHSQRPRAVDVRFG